MPRSLWLLMALRAKSWGRSLARNLRTIRGIVLALVGLGILGMWLWAMSQAPSDSNMSPEELRQQAPVWLVAYCLITVLLSKGERGIYFNPAEVQFLFAGPFTRRQLLLYKILSNALFGLFYTLFFTILFRVHARWGVAAYVGLYLTVLFLQLFTMALGLIAVWIGSQAYTQARRWLLVALGIGAAVFLFRASQDAGGGGLRGILEHFSDTEFWKTGTAPLRWFVEAFLVEPGDWLELARWGGLALTLTLLCALLILLLDAQYLESAAATSERVYATLQRMRRGEAVTVEWSSRGGTAGWGLRMFPWWGGVGPMAWRQTTTALRSLGRLALVVLLMGSMLLGPLFAAGRKQDPMGALLLTTGMLLWLSLLLTTLVPFDFRGDLDRMDVLKALPLASWRLVLGQLLTPVIILAILQSLTLLVLGIMEVVEAWVVFWGIACAVPLNMFLFGMDNLLFLWFPSRIWATNPADFQALGRNVVILLVKTTAIVVAGAAAIGAGFLGWFVSGAQAQVGIAAGWVVLTGLSVALLPLVASAFDAFDVSRDIPA